jgi:hypothetical protein
MTMKTKPSSHTKRSRPHHASSKVQSNRRPKNKEMSKDGSPALHSKKNNGVNQSGLAKVESKPVAKQKLNGAKKNDSAARRVRAADIARAADKKPSDVRQESKGTLARVERNGGAATEQFIIATAVSDRTDAFDWGLNRIWLDWSYSMMPAVLLTTKDLMRRRSPMDLMACSNRAIHF